MARNVRQPQGERKPNSLSRKMQQGCPTSSPSAPELDQAAEVFRLPAGARKQSFAQEGNSSLKIQQISSEVSAARQRVWSAQSRY
jgi:hypothetical protein